MKEIEYLPKIQIGYRTGLLTVEGKTEERKGRYIVWRCRCACGGEILQDTRRLQRGKMPDCGCVTVVRPGIKDLTGRKFGHLTALRATEKCGADGCVIWVCRCELCGEKGNYCSRELLSGNIKSCGKHPKTLVEEGLLDGTSIRKLEYYRAQLFPRTSSGYTGVYKNASGTKWIASMQFQGKKILHAEFASKEDAIEARKRVEKEVVDRFLEEYYAAHPEWDRDFYSRPSAPSSRKSRSARRRREG